ncbi:hypothetical protein [Croceibacter atlanticus]|mgnify:CR=1
MSKYFTIVAFALLVIIPLFDKENKLLVLQIALAVFIILNTIIAYKKR